MGVPEAGGVGVMFNAPGGAADGSSESTDYEFDEEKETLADVTSTRTHFPETWLWTQDFTGSEITTQCHLYIFHRDCCGYRSHILW